MFKREEEKRNNENNSWKIENDLKLAELEALYN
jgi:hypothetical protein